MLSIVFNLILSIIQYWHRAESTSRLLKQILWRKTRYFDSSNIKIFSPLAQIPVDDTELIKQTVKRNREMTEESSSTITVPANFIFRMLTSIYRLRHADDMPEFDDDDDD